VDKRQFVALDFETTGKYPLSAEICEVALIRFTSEGKILETWESLVRPESGMNPVAEGIHGLSLDDLKDAPLIADALPKIIEFTGDSPIVGHNISFDLAFLAYEMDKAFGESWLKKQFLGAHFCTSKISLRALPKLSSHRLKHLVEHFELKEAPNHRAMQDSLTCKDVFLRLISDVESIEDLIELQGDSLALKDFSTFNLISARPELKPLVASCRDKRDFEIIYSKGSRKGQWRKLNPHGLVLKTNDESFLVATDPGETQTKRFMLSKILDSSLDSTLDLKNK
jgi:DNA polymerase III epsilon subunit-like protein